MSFLDHSCVFQIVHGSNLSQLFSALISLCFCIFHIFTFSGVGDHFFCVYSSSRILMSFLISG